MLIVLTGPPGAGKSTTANNLAKHFKKSVKLSIDTFRDFVIGGNLAPWDKSKESIKLHKMTDGIVEDAIKTYIRNGYTVILDGIYSDKDLINLKKKFGKVIGFILLPTLKITRSRDKERPKDQQVPHRVKPLHDNFSENKSKHFIILDTSGHSPMQTVKFILNLIARD